MGQGADVNTGPPTLKGPDSYELAWGNQPSPLGTGWHVCTRPSERVTWAQWQALSAAAVAGPVPFLAAVAASPAAARFTQAETAAAANGIPVVDFRTQVRTQYAAWDGLQPSPWNG